MDEIAEVNDYSKESYAAPRPGEPGAHDGRKKLESITKNLHLVSQTCDTGIANADMSIMLCKEMLDAYVAFSKSDPSQGPPLEHRRQLQDSLEWVLKTWHCQKNWLISYKARKDTAMNFVCFSMELIILREQQLIRSHLCVASGIQPCHAARQFHQH